MSRARALLAAALLVPLVGIMAPVHAHADHSGEIAHVEQAHGGHDAVVLAATDHQKPVGPQAAIPAGRVVLASPEPETVTSGVPADPAKPRVRPPDRRPPTRGPPNLL